MADEAGTAVQKKISEVEGEQGSLKEVGSDPPADFGHDSAASAGTAGNLMPGGGSK